MEYSIIIPIFNSENTLQRTLESVINQSKGFKEIICVDNNSIDCSKTIINEYSRKNSNIFYLHETKPGVSWARNRGLEVATGDYILFLDDDDEYVDENFLESLNTKILQSPKTPLFNFNFIHEFENKEYKKNPFILPEKKYQGWEYFDKQVECFGDEVKHMVWSYAFNRLFLIENNCLFSTKVNQLEDLLFLQKIWMLNIEISVIDLTGVFYHFTPLSSSSQIQDDPLTLLNQVIEELEPLSPTQKRYFIEYSSRILDKNSFLTMENSLTGKNQTLLYERLQINRLYGKIKRKWGRQ